MFLKKHLLGLKLEQKNYKSMTKAIFKKSGKIFDEGFIDKGEKIIFHGLIME